MFLSLNLGRTKPLYLLYLLCVAFLPTQLGKHFWPEYAYVLGLRIDYLSPTIYLSDILVCLTLFLFVLEYIHKIPQVHMSRAAKSSVILMGLVFISVAYFLVRAENPLPALYWVLKLLEAVGFGLMTAVLLQERFLKRWVFWILSCTLFFLSLLSFWQFAIQETVGGIFYWLGERTFSVNTPGIAAGNIDGKLVLRPYAIFPHPNVLAGYFVFALGVCYLFAKDIYRRIPGIVLFIWFVSSLTIILTMSRTGIFLLGMFWFIYFLLEHRRHKVLILLTALLLVGAAVFSLMYFGRILDLDFNSESIYLRRELGFISGQMILAAPLFGVGPNQFLPFVPEFAAVSLSPQLLQPVHNIFLLTFAELGVLGFSVLVVALYIFAVRISRRKNDKVVLWFLFFSFLFIGVLEHYFLTLQQGQLLFSFLFGVIYAETRQSFSLRNLEKFPNSKVAHETKLPINEKYSIGQKKKPINKGKTKA